MKEQQKQCDTQPAQFQETSSRTSRAAFSGEKTLTAEQYREWEQIAARLRKDMSRHAE
ncbi:hypothetical protein RZQ49_26835 [Klebsiella michiganensis]|uniref:hypothetical protein n=1 Tax=Klebsiella TaxID=570 RepID=UPI0007CCD665|nr:MULTISPECIES: hypothetical protein [Klebsiella]MDV1434471.1 hypothetical protein [Klebsiella michiganensis]MDZ0184910.1 hypothetical protein [Klebsiella quasipneumoniae]SAX86699.1 Uncharacterised protein [Klebsiella pneumoniae]